MNTQNQTQTQQKPQITEEAVKIYIKRNTIHAEKYIKLNRFKIKLEQQIELYELSNKELVEAAEKAKVGLERCVGRVQERLSSLMRTLESIEAEWYSKTEAEYFVFEWLRDIDCVKYVVFVEE